MGRSVVVSLAYSWLRAVMFILSSCFFPTFRQLKLWKSQDYISKDTKIQFAWFALFSDRIASYQSVTSFKTKVLTTHNTL